MPDNRLYPDPSIFENTQLSLPVEQPQFNTAVQLPQQQTDWQDAEARANLASRSLVGQPAMQAFEARPAGNQSQVKLTPVDYNPFNEVSSHVAAVQGASQSIGTVQEASARMRPYNSDAFDMAMDVFTDTWPAHMIKSATTLPGDVLTGREPLRDAEGRITEKVVERAQDIAGLAAGGAFATVKGGTATLGSGPVRRLPSDAIEIFRGESSYNRSGSAEGVFYTPNAEWARQFTQSGLENEVVRRHIRESDVYNPPEAIYAGNTEAVDVAIAAARKDGKKAVRLSEGQGEPPSVFVFNKSALFEDSSTGTGISAVANSRSPRFYSAVEHAIENVRPEFYGKTGPFQPNPKQKATGAEWLNSIQNARGVKPEELDWMGLREFLNENRGKPVTREQVQNFVNENRVEVKEVQKHNLDDRSIANIQRQFEIDNPMPRARPELSDWRAKRDTYVDEVTRGIALPRYKDYQLPGGENYRELLLTLPEYRSTDANRLSAITKRLNEINELPSAQHKDVYPEFDRLIAERKEIQGKRLEQGEYRNPHWSEPNVLAHVRMNDRMVGDKKSLHLEEIQSDWHQAGRDQGYHNQNKSIDTSEWTATQNRNGSWDVRNKAGIYVMENVLADQISRKTTAKEAIEAAASEAVRNPDHNIVGVPDAPFKKTWHELALKRMLREAAERGYERLSWTPGEAQAARYDLSKRVERLELEHNRDGIGNLTMHPKGDGRIQNISIKSKQDLIDHVGKDLAEKLYEKGYANNGQARLDNLDLRVGGEGMRGFYDRIIPKSLEKIGKEWGVRVQQGETPSGFNRGDGTNKYGWEKGDDGKYYVLDQNNNRIGPALSSRQEASRAMTELMNDRMRKMQPVHYIDIPPAMRDTINRRGMPLFAGGFVLVPVEGDPFAVDQSQTNR